jgi:23S rRNA U2552 (ribose-2'-O)-methylase RlmE/FtsJ
MDYLIKPPWKNITWFTLPKRIELYDNTIFSYDLDKNNIDKLILLKDKISTYNSEKWEYSKKLTNPYELIFTSQGKYPSPSSVCLLHPLSRSYFKMIEILQIGNIWDKLPRDIRTGHVCEGPGGFIQAIYENAERNKKRILATTAMTLKPTHYQVPGWKRASTFLKKNTQINVIYGADGTGDILKVDNQDSFIDTSKRTVHIFTADGGVDFTMNYAAQEETIFPILVASSKIAFRCLVQGGVYILKLFDCVSVTTRDFICSLGAAFDKWSLYKPATSRPCNSEQYFIGIGFRSINGGEILRMWDSHIMWSSKFLKDIYEDNFYKTFMDEQNKRVEDQIVSLEKTFENINLSDSDSIKNIWNTNIQICKTYCSTFHLPVVTPIPEGIKISMDDIS